MQISQEGANFIKSFGDYRSEAYQDGVDRWTIGYGHTTEVYEGMTIDQQQADDYLWKDLVEYEYYVNDYVTVPLTQNQFDAIVSFTYDVGPGTLKHSVLLSFVNAMQWAQAGDAFLEYDHAGGVQDAALTRRRQAERALFLQPPSRSLAWFEKLAKWFHK